jgi:CubicO group peptidase (beta-lactamase class C family)
MKSPLHLWALLLGLLASLPSATAQGHASARFADADRAKKIAALLPEITTLYADHATAKHAPGLVWGIVLDGQLLHTGNVGFANLEKKIPADARTAFRIASMTKSFAALAILKLRDAGKLSLEDTVEKHLPEFRAIKAPTADAPKITLRHLLGMAAGLAGATQLPLMTILFAMRMMGDQQWLFGMLLSAVIGADSEGTTGCTTHSATGDASDVVRSVLG